MSKKKNNLRVTNGILVCDSIVMSVKKKRINLRHIEAVSIALAGFISTIMVFLNMFSFNYSRTGLLIAAAAFSAMYIILSLIGRRAMWFITLTAVGAMAAAYKYLDDISLGFKFVYNVIYHDSYKTEISYYKFLDPDLEKQSVTLFFIFCIWVLALVIYLFTIYHPNSIPPLLVTFPVIEVGLYNGINVSVFWGMLLVSYWLALFAMTAIDMGEYSGGSGGFVRKENLFFPKRQMRLKVTEKCGVYMIIAVMIISGFTAGFLKAVHYKRSNEINEKRIEIRDAVNSFSMENLSESISNITSAFGLTFKVQTHKLGNVDRLKYKNRTDLVVTMSDKYPGAVYLKEYTGAVYKNNEWTQLPDSAYNQEIFKDFSRYDIYPQDFPGFFNNMISNSMNSGYSFSVLEDYSILIESKLRSNRSFAPYSVEKFGKLTYDMDRNAVSNGNSKNSYSYRFIPMDNSVLQMYLNENRRSALSFSDINGNTDSLEDYCNSRGLIDSGYLLIDTELANDYNVLQNSPDTILAELLQEDYEQFVYDNYLQIPDNKNMDEIRSEFIDIIGMDIGKSSQAAHQLEQLRMFRAKVAEMTTYSLSPGRTPNNRDFVNYFLFENKKGYCTHFATTGVILARMAGIPARYATGYVVVGDDFEDIEPNDDNSYTFNVQDERSHAWIEVYLSGYGWVPFEFTAGYTEMSINTEPVTTTTTETADPDTTTTAADQSQPKPDTTRNNNTHTTSQTAVPVTTTGGGTTGKAGIPGGIGTGGGGHIPKLLKLTIDILAGAAVMVLMVYLRRRLIIFLRRKHFRESSAKKRIEYMYRYTMQLLKLRDIVQNDAQYVRFAEQVEQYYGGLLFDEGNFSEFMDVSLRTFFSQDTATEEELIKCRKFTAELAENIYSKSNRVRKFFMTYVSVLKD